MTNFEHIKSLTLDELATWLDEYGQFDYSPWSTWFNETYCNKCEAIKCKYEDTEKLLGFSPYRFGPYSGDCSCAFCELEHKCRFFPELSDIPSNTEIIKLWLDTEKD